jgi:hypothetical protein
VSIAAAFRDRMIYAKAYGTADLEHRVETRKTTAFRTASVAKPLTATAVMTLVETGRLDLDAPIRTYGGAWPEKHPVITVRQVLGHLAGIRHYAKPGESAGKTHYFTLVDSLALFKDDAVIHEPGTKYQPVWKIRPLDSLIDRSIATRRFLTNSSSFLVRVRPCSPSSASTPSSRQGWRSERARSACASRSAPRTEASSGSCCEPG